MFYGEQNFVFVPLNFTFLMVIYFDLVVSNMRA
jgi:hypothetical protein